MCPPQRITSPPRRWNQSRPDAEAVRDDERLGFLAHEIRNLVGTAFVAFEVLRTGNVGVGGSTAFKFTRAGTTVTLRGSATSDRVLIEVEDECGGLPDGDVKALFQPFEQRGADRTGLGLGLAVSRWGAETNNGRIYARNLPDHG